MPREKSRYRSDSRRRSASSSSDSHDKHKSKSKRRKRSRSRESLASHRYRRSRSSSHDRYPNKRSATNTHSKKAKRRSPRSGSRDKHRSSKSHKRSVRRRSVSTGSSSSMSSKSERSSLAVQRSVDDTDIKIEKAIKAAEAAGLTLTKLPTYEYKEVVVKEDMPSITDRNLLQELNNDSFVSKPFISSRNKKFANNIVIDLDTQTVKVPEVEAKEEETILRLDKLPSDEELKEMWIKKLYAFRKKLLENM